MKLGDAWKLRAESGGAIRFETAKTGQKLIFPWKIQITPTCVIPSRWNDDGAMSLPALIIAPDFGAMLMRCNAPSAIARLIGDFPSRRLELHLDFPETRGDVEISVSLSPFHLAAPEGLSDVALWSQGRRAWLNAFQPSCINCGNAQRDPNPVPSGMLGNSSIVGPASCSIWFYADQALFAPQLSPGISVMDLVRQTVDWILRTRVRDNGQVVTYWMLGADYADFLDGGASLLIAAWDIVESKDDLAWLRERIDRLEMIGNYLAARDVDGDGLAEAVQSGNAGTLVEPARGCSWWDALNSGHKDAYCNALIYRAWRCLADLENRLGRIAQRDDYNRLADRLREAFAPALLNPQTGWLAWWRSAEGVLHDYASPHINGLAIEYGLIPPAQGREILAKLRAKMHAVGFDALHLGVPPMLEPVRKADYLSGIHGNCGEPMRDDGRDTFGKYMNGGISAGQSLHFLAAHYVVNDPQPADAILRAMLPGALRGAFQNGIRVHYPHGADWRTWSGEPSGADGYLADNYRFLQAILLREKSFREKLYRPLNANSR